MLDKLAEERLEMLVGVLAGVLAAPCLGVAAMRLPVLPVLLGKTTFLTRGHTS